MSEPCPHGDATCPCQDGDVCHYGGPDPMRCPRTDLIGLHSVRKEATMSEPYCMEPGCPAPADTERPVPTTQGEPVVELVCHDHEAPTE